MSAILARCATGLGVMFLFSIAAPAWADDGDDPGYVNESSRRAPTKIVPPQSRVARQTAQDTKPSTARDARPGDAQESQDDFERRLRAQEWERGAIREYGIGGTRSLRYRDGDTPLTFLPPLGLCGLSDPFALQAAVEDAYAAGRADERNSARTQSDREWEARKTRLLTKHQQAVQAGLEKLRAGDYERAVIALTLAAKLDQGDPACRIHLAQTRLALGHYQEAALALRRALQLQPKLAYFDMHLDQHYPAEGTTQRFREALTEWSKNNDPSAEINFLRGYLDYQTGDFASAHRAFLLAARDLKDDDLTRDFLAITKPAEKLTSGR